ncbi:hypothetical protein FPCIR_2487 [Fusarium pseudocircinatum]|uniref:WSC domain-containing protein n=1 Tax=Fusarium pseudocircinatum TaxID=56676 RepID=A0A8H5PMW6_9HYPO|nr:hypothetical protein FPCIR_2487 [Fusarium pseudocircinatum]
MRLTSGLLLASASCAFGQFTRFTNSSTSAAERATSSSSLSTPTSILPTTTTTGTTNGLPSSSSIETNASPSASRVASFALDLRNAILGPGASLYPPPDGASMQVSPRNRQNNNTTLTLYKYRLMSPVASDSTLRRRQRIPLPFPIPNIAPDNSYASFKANISRDVGSALGISVNRIVNVTIASSSSRRKRAESSPCVFQVFVDGELALAVPISGSFGNLQLSTNPIPPKDEYDMIFRQSCNGDKTGIILQGAAIQNGQGAVSTPIPSIIIGTPTGTSATNSVEFTTNSEGETIFPTETAPAASSEAATTPSGGETVLTTGATAGTNSEGFTTNTEGETIFPTETATEVSSAGGSVNSEGGTAGTATGNSPSATATLPTGFPGEVGEFTLFGCVASNAGFPTFTLAQSNPKMDLGICATLCAGRSYFGVHDTACYCGDEVGSATSRVALDQCNIECPGDNTQFCGGESNSKLRIRQTISSNILLAVYVALEAGVTLTESITQTVTDQRTIVTTFTTTVTNTGASSIATEVIAATLVCSAGKCHSTNSATVYVFVEINGSDYDGQWVYISEPCSCAGGQRPHQGVNWNATAPHGASGGGSKSNSNNGDSGNSQGGSSSGSSSGSNNGDSSPGSNRESGGGSDTSPNGTPNGGSNDGSGSGTQGESQNSNVPGSKGSYPSTVPVISSASTHVSRMISLLAALAALL